MFGKTSIMEKTAKATMPITVANVIVKFGADDSHVAVSSAATDSHIGVVEHTTSVAEETVRVVLAGIAEVRLGGTVTRGNQITSNASGYGVVAVAGDCVIGRALASGVANDVIPVMLYGGAPVLVAQNTDGLHSKLIARATFDPSGKSSQRAVGAHGLGVYLPAKAILTNAILDISTAFTSTNSTATIAIHAQSANDIVTALSVGDASSYWNAGIRGTKIGYPNLGADAAHDTQAEVAALFAGTMLKLSAQREITVTVGTEDLTAGKMNIFVEYYIGD